jgi:hypothetical protein
LLWREAAEKADVLAVDGLVDAHGLGAEQAVEVVAVLGPVAANKRRDGALVGSNPIFRENL